MLVKISLSWDWCGLVGVGGERLDPCKGWKARWSLWHSWYTCYVQNCDIAVHSVSLDSWPRPEDEYVCDSVSYQLSGIAAIGVTGSKSHLSSAFICVSFSFQTCRSHLMTGQISFTAHLTEFLCLLSCSGCCGALLACTSFFSAPCLVLGDPSQRAGCALVTNQSWKKIKPLFTFAFLRLPYEQSHILPFLSSPLTL